MRHALAVLAAVVLLGLPSQAAAQAPKSVEPFNVATVDIAGREAVALVLRDQHVVELTGANGNLEMTGNYPAVTVPDDMVALVGQYEYGLKNRIYEIDNHVVGKGQLTEGTGDLPVGLTGGLPRGKHLVVGAGAAGSLGVILE